MKKIADKDKTFAFVEWLAATSQRVQRGHDFDFGQWRLLQQYALVFRSHTPSLVRRARETRLDLSVTQSFLVRIQVPGQLVFALEPQEGEIDRVENDFDARGRFFGSV
jgi:hypothetical protein